MTYRDDAPSLRAEVARLRAPADEEEIAAARARAESLMAIVRAETEAATGVAAVMGPARLWAVRPRGAGVERRAVALAGRILVAWLIGRWRR